DTPAAMVPMSINHAGEICCYQGLNRNQNELISTGIDKLLDSVDFEFEERYVAIANALDVQEALFKVGSPQCKRLGDELARQANQDEQFAQDLQKALEEVNGPHVRKLFASFLGVVLAALSMVVALA